jgi:hypothetical protein
MDESKLIDWYEVVEAVANGRLTGHACPICRASPLEAEKSGARVRVRCPRCGEGFAGNLAHGRDDSLYAEADALLRKREKAAAPAAEAPAPLATTAAAAPAPPAKPEPWEWQLPASARNDGEGLAVWMDLVEAAINGRRTGLRCPFCSEPLSEVFYDDPHLRLRCGVCGEAFEGRVR